MYTRLTAKGSAVKVALGIGLAAVMVASAVPANATVAPLYPASEMNNALVGSGSDTTYDMMKAIDKIYAGANGCAAIWDPSADQPNSGTCDPDVTSGTAPYQWVNDTHDTVAEQAPVGSGFGTRELCTQGATGTRNVDFARSSSSAATSISSKNCKDLMYVAYAKDAISWWHKTDAGSTSKDIATISVDVLKAIYSATATSLPCEAGTPGIDGSGNCNVTIDSWDKLNGLSGVKDASGKNFGYGTGHVAALAANPLVVYYAQPGSGTVDKWLAWMGLTGFPTSNPRFKSTVIENLPSAIASADLPNAIYFMSWGRFRQANGLTGNYAGGDDEFSVADDSALGQVNGIKPLHGNILDSTFTFQRSVFNVLRYPSAKVLRYLGPDGLLCSPTKRAYTDRANGKTYGTMIDDAIKAEGFAPFPAGKLGPNSFAGKYGVSATPTTQDSYCRTTELVPAMLSSAGGTVGIKGIDPSDGAGSPSAAGGSFSITGEPLTSVDTGKLGIKVAGAYVPATYTCWNQRVEAVDCAGDATARYGQALISYVTVEPTADLRGSSLSFVAEDGFGADRAEWPIDVTDTAQTFASFDPQTVTVGASVKRKKSINFSASTNASQAITAVSLTKAVCTVTKSGANYVVKGKKKGSCLIRLTAVATTGYNDLYKTVVVKVK